jgi:hypothetical protein
VGFLARYLTFIDGVSVNQLKLLERATRIELAFSAWEADVLPLNYARMPYIVLRPEPPPF